MCLDTGKSNIISKNPRGILASPYHFMKYSYDLPKEQFKN